MCESCAPLVRKLTRDDWYALAICAGMLALIIVIMLLAGE